MPQVFDSQNAFNAGELSPRVLGRSLIPAYKSGLRICENMILLLPGGMERRPGTHFVSAAFDETKRSRLIPFRFSFQEAMVIELADGAFRIFKDGAAIPYRTHSALSTANVGQTPDELVINPHGYPHGFRVVATDQAGTLPAGLTDAAVYQVERAQSLVFDQSADVVVVSNRLTKTAHGLSAEMGPYRLTSTDTLPGGLLADTDYYVVIVSADQIQLSLTAGGAGVAIGSTGTGFLTMRPTNAYTRSRFRLSSGGTIATLSGAGVPGWQIAPVIPTQPFQGDYSYTEAELFDIQYAQDKDVLYLAHADHPLARMVRYADWAWEVEPFEMKDGPYLDLQESLPGVVESDTTITMSAVTVGPDRTATASKALFSSVDVDRMIRVGQDSDAANWGWGRITSVAPYLVETFPLPEFGSLNVLASATPDTPTGLFNFSVAFLAIQATQVAVGHVYSSTHATFPVGSKIYATWAGVGNSSYAYTSFADATADTGRVNFTGGQNIIAYTSVVFDFSGPHAFSDGAGPVTLSASGTMPTGWSEGATYALRVYGGSTTMFSIADSDSLIELPPETDPLLAAPIFVTGGSSVKSTTAKVKVEEEMPPAATGAMKAWKLGAFGPSADLGYPAAVGLHEQRLVLGGASGTPQTVYGSFSGQQQTFAPDEVDPAGAAYERVITSASGYVFRLVSEDLNAIGWLRPARALFAAGLGGIFHLTGATVTDTLTPTSVNARRGTTKGASNVSPVMIGSAVIFVDEAQRRVQHGEFRPDIEAIQVNDLMQLADHLAYGFTMSQLARTETPLPLVWASRSDGTLLSVTLEQTQNVLAWARHPLGGTDAKVESVATLPDAQGGQLWMVVSRTIDGVTRRYVEYMAERIDEISDPELFQCGDSGPLPYDGASIPAGTPITGLDHLEGELVEIIADGGLHPDRIVSGGTVTLDRAATKVVVGLPFTGRARLLPPEIEQPGQHLSMRTIRSITATIRLNNSLGIKVGPELDRLTELEFRSKHAAMDTPPPSFTGLKEIAVPGGYGKDGGLWLISEHGFPCQILSVLQRIEVVQR